MKYWQNYKRKIKLFLLKGKEKPCSETENSFGENKLPLFEIENSFGENFDQTIRKNKNKKNFIP